MTQATEKLFRALADEERLRILNLLLVDRDGACVCELVDSLRIPQYQVSRQLAVLRDAGLVEGEKRGTWVYYRIAPELPRLHRTVLDSLFEHLESSPLEDDRDRFARRLQLRQEGACTVGYPSQAPYREIIPIEEVARHGQIS